MDHGWLDEFRQLTWLAQVCYARRLGWETIAIFKHETEAAAYVARHNKHGRAGTLRYLPLAALAESSEEPDLPALIYNALAGNSATTGS